jgi:hypothetical protein
MVSFDDGRRSGGGGGGCDEYFNLRFYPPLPSQGSANGGDADAGGLQKQQRT